MKNTKKTKKKKNPLSVVGLVAVILVVAMALGLGISALLPRSSSSRWTDKDAPEGETEMKPHLEGAQGFLEENAASGSMPESVPTGTATPAPTEEPTPEPGDDPEASASPGTSGGGGTTHFGGFGNDSTPRPTTSATSGPWVAPPPTPEPIPTISFPYTIPGTNLVVQQISPYSGYFLEDGSDRSVSNVAAIVLTNNGAENLAFAGIGIAQGEKSYAFSGSQIPAGATVILQEQNAAALTGGDFHSCTASTTAAAASDKAAGRVQVTDNGDNTFDVANITGETIPEIKVYFKNYLPGEDVYVGGITYSVTLANVEPGTAATVNSDHYASEYSVVVDVTTQG